MLMETTISKKAQPPAPANNVVEEILASRKATYGDFAKVSQITEEVKKAMEKGENWTKLDDQTRTALFFIANKVARIVEGVVTEDSVRDIQGYAELILKTSTNVVR